MKNYFISLMASALVPFWAFTQIPTQQPYSPAPAAVSNIVKAELFSGNIDPDFGNATNLPVPNTTDVTVTNVTVTIPSLPNGVQTFYLRTLDATGKWSITNYKNYFVGGVNYPPAPIAENNIVNAEVFAGNADPGIGNATPLVLPTGIDVTATNTTVTIPALSNGVQTFYLRTLDATGKWSITNYQNYFVGGFGYPAAPAALSNIVKAEYYTGATDPGIGSASPLPIPTGTDVTTGTVNITIPALANGNQSLFIRTLDANGKWSVTNFKDYTVGIFGYPLTPSAPPSIGNVEYYIGTDPGFGNGTPITFAASADVQLTNIPITISGTLPNGTYVFHIRSKQNPWSIDNAKTFTIGGAVPLTWSYVTAQLQNAQTLVSWATEQEINTAKFEIERSTDGLRFEKIGTQLAAGNSTSVKKYSFIDAHPATGFNYYRIKQIDADGRFTYSVIVKVLNKENIKEAFIAPNPVTAMLNLIEPTTTFIQTLEVYDSKGTVVLRKNVSSEVQVYSLPVANLPNGNYVLKVSYKNKVKSIAFVK
jgi:Secretion system C-terminal sorting domain